MPERPLFITDDAELREELLRLAAVAGADPSVVDPDAATAAWAKAPLVVVGVDSAAACVRTGFSRRSGVVLACAGAVPPSAWELGVGLGVDRVLELPAAEEVLVGLLAAAGSEPSGPTGSLITVLAGRGGAGASVLSAALAVRAARQGRRPLLVDIDPLGGGADLLLGAEQSSGARWHDLRAVAGPLPAAALRAALPEAGGVAVLSTGREDPLDLPTTAVRAVLSAGRRCADPVVVDVSRALGHNAEAAMLASTRVLLVVTNEVRAVAAAGQMVRWARHWAVAPELVVRRDRAGGLSTSEIAAALNIEVAGEFRTEPWLARALDLGEPPGHRRGALTRLAERLLARAAGQVAG
ncbi:MAG: hypothetical protein HYR62_10255 [Actinobacteria bacterium]|nr:hypothetical protein [Actinomycetota bacterium]MBI3686371.1 hypothetical protein [Actinomycetota bacterium]